MYYKKYLFLVRKLFDASDHGSKGYLSQDELNQLFGKLQHAMPHADVLISFLLI